MLKPEEFQNLEAVVRCALPVEETVAWDAFNKLMENYEEGVRIEQMLVCLLELIEDAHMYGGHIEIGDEIEEWWSPRRTKIRLRKEIESLRRQLETLEAREAGS